jgi:hypothetical protein
MDLSGGNINCIGFIMTQWMYQHEYYFRHEAWFKRCILMNIH